MRSESELKVVFLDVGEGDAILITRGHRQVLIDGGREGRRLLSHLGRYIPFSDRTIEAVIATHPDADHIGGFPQLFEQYAVRQFLSTGAESKTESSALLSRSREREGLDRALTAIAGTTLTFPGEGRLSVLFPPAPVPVDMAATNDGSVVARFDFAGTSFLLTGDLPDEAAYIPEISPATILKVAHHGSRYSTSDTWLASVQPHEAIISVGENTYGHPASEVLERLTAHGVRIFRTDEQGDIVYRCREEWGGCRRDE